VSSDSEVTDIFRQLFFLILSPFISRTLLDQIYMLLMLNMGVIVTYFFAESFFKKVIKDDHYKKKIDFLAFFAGFFYLFNLNTVATFYFPMVMYTTRFAAIPLIFLAFLSLLYKEKVSKKDILIFFLVSLLTSGTYLTATIMITVFIALILFGLFQKNFKRFAALLIFYLIVQSFWLLPFLNYASQKSNILKLAPTFINANESQLNKNKQFYSFKKQLQLYPNFFDTEYTNLANGIKEKLHPLATLYAKFPFNFLFWIFPITYILGSFLVVLKGKLFKNLLWLPLTIFLFLFLSLKEFSPFGLIYSSLNKIFPLFDVLFRFGDTKFHIFISFAGSLVSGFVLIALLKFIKGSFRSLLFLALLLTMIFSFKYYFNGQLAGSFMYNKIPSAYFEIAEIINHDTSFFRVLHLPFDNEAYWKSYSWGAFGSSFFHYLIDKPFIDKTFEPGSMENAYLDSRISQLITNTQAISTDEEKEKRAKAFATLLNKTGIKYLIIDDTVQAAIPSRNMLLWGKFNNADVKVMGNYLKQYGLAKSVKEYQVDGSTIELLEVDGFQNNIIFLDKISYLDPGFDNFLQSDLSSENNHVIQVVANPSFQLFPFKRLSQKVDVNERSVDFSFTNPIKIQDTQIILSKNNNVSDEKIVNYIDIYGSNDGQDVLLNFYLRKLPDINGQNFSSNIKEVKLPLEKIVNRDIKLRVSNYVTNIPTKLTQDLMYISTVSVTGNNIPLDFLTENEIKEIVPASIRLTDNPNCYSDKLKNGSSNLSLDYTANLSSQNQSTCFYYDLSNISNPESDYIKLDLSLSGNSNDLDSNYGSLYNFTSKPRLKNLILAADKPNYLYLCAKEAQVDDCFNNAQIFNIKGNKEITLDLEKYQKGLNDLTLFGALKNIGYEEQNLSINKFMVTGYKSILSDSLEFRANDGINLSLKNDGQELNLSFPRVLSNSSFDFNLNDNGLLVSGSSCDASYGYRTFREVNGLLVSYVENCYNEAFKKVDFSSDKFYFWNLNYNLLSGKYPRFILDDGLYHYADNYISLYQGYPDISGFKTLQHPENIFTKPPSFENLIFSNAFGFIYPDSGVGDEKPKQFTIHQDSENEGVMAIKLFMAQPLPTQWADMKVVYGNSQSEFNLPDHYETHQILPSLWKVTVNFSKEGDYLLLFNEGYDKQWQLSGNISPLKCDGYANCFIVSKKDNLPVTRDFYIFYTPEKLYFFGWLVTLLSLAVFPIIFKKF
jgi:hypothetical protein